MGGAASSASKMTDALDNFVRGAGGMDAETPSGMDAAKVTLSLFLGERGNGVGQRVFLVACVVGVVGGGPVFSVERDHPLVLASASDPCSL